MTEFFSYSQKGELLGKTDEPVSKGNFERYMNDYSTERALGYRDAINDVCKIVHDHILHYTDEFHDGLIFSNSPPRVRTALKQLHETHELLLEHMAEILGVNVKGLNNDTMLEP